MIMANEPSTNIEDRRFVDPTRREYFRKMKDAISDSYRTGDGKLLERLKAIEDEFDIKSNDEYWNHAEKLAKSDPKFMKQLEKLMKGE